MGTTTTTTRTRTGRDAVTRPGCAAASCMATPLGPGHAHRMEPATRTGPCERASPPTAHTKKPRRAAPGRTPHTTADRRRRERLSSYHYLFMSDIFGILILGMYIHTPGCTGTWRPEPRAPTGWRWTVRKEATWQARSGPRTPVAGDVLQPRPSKSSYYRGLHRTTEFLTESQ